MNTGTTTYIGDPTLNLYAFGDVEQIYGSVTSNAQMDNFVASGGYSDYGTYPAGAAPYLDDDVFDSGSSTQGGNMDLISIPAGTRLVWAGNIYGSAGLTVTSPGGGGSGGPD